MRTNLLLTTTLLTLISSASLADEFAESFGGNVLDAENFSVN